MAGDQKVCVQQKHHQQPSKQRVSALDIRALISSIRPKVVGLRLANIYDFNSGTGTGGGGGGGGGQSSYILKFAGKDSKVFLFIHPGFRVYTTEWKKDKGTLPSPFCMRLRKSLRTKKLEDLQQHGADRVVSLLFGKGENRLHLIVELYVAGNVLLTDSQHLMLAVLRRHTLVTPTASTAPPVPAEKTLPPSKSDACPASGLKKAGANDGGDLSSSSSSASSSLGVSAISKVQKFAVREVYQMPPPALSLLRHGISPGALTPEIVQQEVLDILNKGEEKPRESTTPSHPTESQKEKTDEDSSSSSSSSKKKSRSQLTYQQILSTLVPFSNPALAVHALLTATEDVDDKDIHKKTFSKESLAEGSAILYKAVIECLKALKSVSSPEDFLGEGPSMPSYLSFEKRTAGAEREEQLPLPGWILATRRGHAEERKGQRRAEGGREEGEKVDEEVSRTSHLYDYDDFSPILLRQYQSLRVLPAPQQIQLEEEIKASVAVKLAAAGAGGKGTSKGEEKEKRDKEEGGEGQEKAEDDNGGGGAEDVDKDDTGDVSSSASEREDEEKKKNERGELEENSSKSSKSNTTEQFQEGVEAAIQAVHGDVLPGTRVLLYFKDINRCVDEFFSSSDIQKGEKAERLAKKEALSRVDKIRTDQDTRIRQLETEIEALQRQTGSLSGNILLVDQIIQLIRAILATGADWRELKRQLHEQRKAGHPLVTHIHDIEFEREKVLVLLPRSRDFLSRGEKDAQGEGEQEEECEGEAKGEDKGAKKKDGDSLGKAGSAPPGEKEQEEGGGEYYDDELMETVLVPVDFSLSAHGNVELLFSQIKQLKSKLQKTISAKETAIAHADKKAKKRIELQDQQLFLQQQLQLQKLRKPFWFEKFLWFVTSDSYLVLAGRDSQQNEILFRRYLRRHDIYVHADVHGAATCIIKNRKPHSALPKSFSTTHAKEDDSPDAKKSASCTTSATGTERGGGGGSDGSSASSSALPVPLSTLQQCGEYAVCRSSAWKSKTPAAAWWVYGRQVSKSAPSGLYLSTGSFMIRGKRNFIPVHRLEMGFGLLFRLGDEASVSRHLPASHHVHHASGEGGIKGGEDVDSDIEDNTVDLKIEESPSPVEMKEKSLAGSEVDQEAASPDVVTSSSPGKRKKEEAQTREQDKKKKNETSSLVEGSASSPPPVSLSASPECPPTSPSSSSSALPVVSSSVRKKCVFTTPGEEAAKIRGGGGKEENEEEPTAREGDSHHPGSARRTSGGKKSARIGFVEGSSPPSSAADDNRLSGEEEEALASGREGGVSSRSEGGGPSGGGGVTVRFSSTEKTGELLESASASVSRRKNRKPTGFLRDADIRKKAGLEALREVMDSRRASDVEVSLIQREDVIQQLEQQAERQRQLEEQLAQVKQQLEAQLREASATTSPSRAGGSKSLSDHGGSSTDRRGRTGRGSVDFDPSTVGEDESHTLRETAVGRRIRRRHPTGHLTAKGVAELLGELAGEEIRQMQEQVEEEQAREALRRRQQEEEEEARRRLAEEQGDGANQHQQENGLLSSSEHSTPPPPCPTTPCLDTLVPLQQELLQRQYSAETHQRLMMEKLREVALQHGVEGIVSPPALSATSASGRNGSSPRSGSENKESAEEGSGSGSSGLAKGTHHPRPDRPPHPHSHRHGSRHRRSLFRSGKGSGVDDCHVTFSPDPPKVVEKTITALHVDFDGLPPEVIPPRPDDDLSGGDPLLLRLEEELKEEQEEEKKDEGEGCASSSSSNFRRRGTGWVKGWKPPSDEEEDDENAELEEEGGGRTSFEVSGEEGGPPPGFVASSPDTTTKSEGDGGRRGGGEGDQAAVASRGEGAGNASAASGVQPSAEGGEEPRESPDGEDGSLSAPVCLRLITHDNETGEISAIELGSSFGSLAGRSSSHASSFRGGSAGSVGLSASSLSSQRDGSSPGEGTNTHALQTALGSSSTVSHPEEGKDTPPPSTTTTPSRKDNQSSSPPSRTGTNTGVGGSRSPAVSLSSSSPPLSAFSSSQQNRRDSTVSFSGEGEEQEGDEDEGGGGGESRRRRRSLKKEGRDDEASKGGGGGGGASGEKKKENEDPSAQRPQQDEGLSSCYSSSRLNSRGLTMTTSSRQDSWRRSPSAYSERSILSVQSSTSIGSRMSRRMSVDEGPPPDGFTEETLPTPRELLSHSSLDIQNSGGDDDTSDEREIHIIVRRLSIKEEKELVRCRSADRGPTPKGFACTDVPSAKDLLTLQQYLSGKLSSPDQGRSEDDATTSAGTRRSRRAVSEGNVPSVFSEMKRFVSSGGEEGGEEGGDEVFVDLCSSDHFTDEEEEEDEGGSGGAGSKGGEGGEGGKEGGGKTGGNSVSSGVSISPSSEGEDDEDDTSSSSSSSNEDEGSREKREGEKTSLSGQEEEEEADDNEEEEDEQDTTEDDEDTDDAVEEEEEKTRKKKEEEEEEEAEMKREEEEREEEEEEEEEEGVGGGRKAGVEEGGAKKKRLSAAERRRLKKKKSPGGGGEEGGRERGEGEAGEEAEHERSTEPKQKKKKDPSLKPLPRGKKSRLAKMKKKYAEQEEEERKLKMILIGAGEMKDVSASGDPVGKGGKGGGVSSSSSSSRKMQAPSSGKRDEDWRDETKTEEEGLDTQDGYLLQHGGAAGVPDDKLLMEQCNQIDLLTANPLPEDALLCAVPVTAPYSAMTKYRYKMKLLPGSMKKGKAGQAILKHFLQDVQDIRQKQLIKGITMSEIALCMVSDVRLSSPGLQKLSTGGGGGDTRHQKKKKQNKQATDE